MKRSQALIYMQKIYSIRHCMVEGRYITLEQFFNEMLAYMENKGLTQEWEPEEESLGPLGRLAKGVTNEND